MLRRKKWPHVRIDDKNGVVYVYLRPGVVYHTVDLSIPGMMVHVDLDTGGYPLGVEIEGEE